MEQRLLKDHIDEPIQKCVVGMALLGFTPVMSCCGFTYKGEKVPKSHIFDKPYIYLDKRATDYPYLKGKLHDLAFMAQWTISFMGNDFIDFYRQTSDKTNCWLKDGAVHRYEASILGINALEKTIERVRDSFMKEAKIVDGNRKYINEFKIKHWQYEPCEDWIVTPETFDAL